MLCIISTHLHMYLKGESSNFVKYFNFSTHSLSAHPEVLVIISNQGCHRSKNLMAIYPENINPFCFYPQSTKICHFKWPDFYATK